MDFKKDLLTYKVSWADFNQIGQGISAVASNTFDWIADPVNKIVPREEQISSMLEQDPSLDITNRDDGFELDNERLFAIQQKRTRPLQVIDINPGLLDPIANAFSLPFESIFDGANFIPNQNGSLSANWRTVNIPIAGNFVKIEFIYENNGQANRKNDANIANNSIPPYPFAQLKYSSAIVSGNELDLTTGQSISSFDSFARTKVFLNFSSLADKPHIITKSGDSFDTYFSELNLTLNIGSPKIRVTIGFNSTKSDGPSNAEVNSKFAITGAGRLFNEIDTVLSPFCITEVDNGDSSTININGRKITNIGTTGFQIIKNSAFGIGGTNAPVMGYSVFWITKIYFRISQNAPNASDTVNSLTVKFFVSNGTSTRKRVHSFRMFVGEIARSVSGTIFSKSDYTHAPTEAIRVVLPAGHTFSVEIDSNTSSSDINIVNSVSYAIDGYSLGEFARQSVVDIPQFRFVYTTKFLTDATFLADYNRLSVLADP